MTLFKDFPWKQYVYHLVALSVSLVFFTVGLVMEIQLTDQRDAVARKVQAARVKEQQARDSVEILSDALERYLKYQGRGYIGEAQRLSWVESLQSIALELYLPDVQYTLDNTEPADETNSALSNPELAMTKTNMRVNFDVKHERDFEYLFENLAADARGLFVMDKCEMSKISQGGVSGDIDQYKGDCDIVWYTLANVVEHWSVPSEEEYGYSE